MKILAVNLLRLGDIIMTVPALRALRKAHPHAELHVLINSQFKSVTSLLPFVDQFHFLDRNNLQSGLGEGDTALLHSFDLLKETVDQLNSKKFDRLYNFTHNSLSAWLSSLIDSKEKIGLSYDQAAQAHFGSNWFSYLNHQTEFEGKDVFHYSDIFQFSVTHSNKRSSLALKETVSGRAEASRLRANREDIVFIQALSSDPKKDWGVERWKKFVSEFAQFHKEATFMFLAAPNEAAQLASIVNELAASGIRAEIAVCSLEGALSLLQEGRLLITADTAIKHIASATQIPMVELCLGSSDPYRTGAYRDNVYIVRSKESCSPCVHSRGCHREKQFCAINTGTQALVSIASCVYSGNTHLIKVVADEFSDQIEVLRTDLKQCGFWTASPVTENLSESAISRWLERCALKLYLNSPANQTDRSDEFLNEIENLSRTLKQTFPEISQAEWNHIFDDVERRINSIETRLTGFQYSLRGLASNYESPLLMKHFIEDLRNFRDRLRPSGYLRAKGEALDWVIEDERSTAFVRYRRISNSLNEMHGRTQIEMKLVRFLKNQMEIL